ncbi:MAG: type VI secretion lipoprotein TssJ [Candidatus Cloacimonetes bacterium]|nr:type VI secretion lipoprotein TssJ [Candidatus Cloacimonadota bacterium]
MFNKICYFVIFLSLPFFIFSCVKKNIIQNTDWSFKEKGIQVEVIADSLLNSFENKPHTLKLVIYQLSDINTFNKQKKTEAGLEKLLLSEPFDPSITAVDHFFIQPGENSLFFLNRAENTKWVAFVAGYFNLVPIEVTEILKIPLQIKKKGFFIRTRYEKIKELNLEIRLGENRILEIKEKK